MIQLTKKTKFVFVGMILLLTLQLGLCETVKVMSFNMWQGGDDWNKCVDAISNSDADIIGLQEAVDFAGIASELGFYYDEGTWTLSRWPITSVQGWGYGQAVTIETPTGQTVHFFNCHLTAYPYAPYELPDIKKALRAEKITQWADLQPILTNMASYIATAKPCFLTGDFNAPSHLDYDGVAWRCSTECQLAGLTDSYRSVHPENRLWPSTFEWDEPGITWTPKPEREPYGIFDRIDFVYCCGDGVSVVDSDAVTNVTPWPSDHRAVLSTVIIPDGTGGGDPATLDTTKDSYAPGEDIIVNYTNAPGNTTDWIGLYVAGSPYGSEYPSILWEYTGGGVDGTITFTDGLSEEGDYEARLFCCDGYSLLASCTFSVAAGGPTGDIFVNDIAMSSKVAGLNYSGKATVWIKDQAGLDTPGATVYGEWSGAVNAASSGTTGADGKVTLQSPAVKDGGTFNFCVTNVTLPGAVYNESLNVETCDSITAP